MASHKVILMLAALAVLGCRPSGEANQDGGASDRKGKGGFGQPIAQPSKHEIVLDHLRAKHPIPKEAVKEEITPGKAFALVEQEWVRVIKNLRKRLEEQ